ncbi:hypothetical protein [Burkholderia latens]|uniref:hypothetical protein n=1 Tax=Burkholderia latens TaxID=488446 RepID=UPI001FC8D0AB|nr:hypothetical protein [Burkholderia latens]
MAAYRSQRTSKLETDLVEQRARLAATENKLSVKIMKAASEDAESPRAKSMRRRGLGDPRRQDLQECGSRIFPGWYAPVLIEFDGKRLSRRCDTDFAYQDGR